MIKEIIDELTETEKSLVNPLLKAKVLANRLGNTELLNWVDKELKGYVGTPPKYRIVKTRMTCDISVGGMIYKENTPFPVLFLNDKELQNFFMQFDIKDGIETIENYFVGGNDTLIKPLGVDFDSIITQHLQKNNFQGRVHNIQISSYKTEVIQCLSNVRNIFLNLMLELEKEFPDVEDVSKEPQDVKEEISNKITIIMAENNYSTGDGSNIVSGSNNNTNFASGKNIRQNFVINTAKKEQIKTVVDEIREFIESNDFEEKDEAKLELQRIENQIEKDQPKGNVISQSLGALKDIFTSVTANLISGPVIESITKLLSSLG
ncbi:hypothetical protein [Mesonia sp. K7]|uniref:AbiTii domain-containing protein n=1 Tax=Mesonia sp. K7 TaxID=2218606 RepID=UPI000DA921F2|nr:hypothetical protein [Mesonia sp. K7]PZD76651.1 hypothetical protein DNG35_11295 [Mesonia sp. K7]